MRIKMQKQKQNGFLRILQKSMERNISGFENYLGQIHHQNKYDIFYVYVESHFFILFQKSHFVPRNVENENVLKYQYVQMYKMMLSLFFTGFENYLGQIHHQNKCNIFLCLC